MNVPGKPLLGGIEAGGTKFVLVVGHSPTEIVAKHSIPTRSPATTLAQAAEWLAQHGAIAALGIASFGPVELDPRAPRWGYITNTPKPGWADCDIAGYFARRLAVPVGFDTDVNGAALAEYAYGAGLGAGSLAYVTVGTGIGGGLVIDGKAVHGAAHPEVGHFYPRRLSVDAEFHGICPHHGDCLEGLASGPAIHARWGASLSDLPADHAAHGIIAGYLAQLCHSLFAMLAVEKVVLGGGVMNTPGLLEKVQFATLALDAGYLPGADKHLLSRPGLGDRSGAVGALLLARSALD